MIVLLTWNLKLQFKTLFYLFLGPSTSLVEHFSKNTFNPKLWIIYLEN